MGYGQYERDFVMERDRRNFIKNNIVKGYNINYVNETIMRQQEEALEQEDAMAIIERLEREKAEDEALKQAEIAELLAQQEMYTEENYNPHTGSYSGSYGKGKITEDNRSQIESILQEKKDEFFSMLENETSKQGNT